MNRAQKRNEILRIKKLSPKQFMDEMNECHTRAYILAEKHYGEAMDIILTPKQKAAVQAKAKEIREYWDGIREITVETTVKEA